MKIAIKVITEWDRLNVIPFFEKHFPYCNYAWETNEVTIGDIFWVSENPTLHLDDNDFFLTPSDYTILQGVPKDFELTKVEPTKTREQKLEECLKNIVSCTRQSGNGRNRLNDNKLGKFHIAIEQAKQLLNK